MKKALLYIIGFVLFFGGMIWWSKSLQSEDPDVIARTGLHWHSTLEIYVNGEKQEVSPNIGVTGGSMLPMHTHEPNGTVHIESAGLVRKDDVTLGRFFEIWRRDFRELGQNVTMTVNGEPNTEYENYEMKDGDKIELRYE